MDCILSFIAGAVHKYYDDVQDTNESVGPLFLETLKVLMVTTMTIMFIRVPSIAVFFIVIIGIYWSLKRVDSDFWKACVPMPFVTLASNPSSLGMIDMFDFLQRLFFVVVVGTIMYFEDGIIPEETSVRKSLVRIGFIGIAGITLWFYRNLPSVVFVAPMISFLIGYLVSNLVYHARTLSPFTSEKQTEVLPTTVLSKPTTSVESLPQDGKPVPAADSETTPLKPN